VRRSEPRKGVEHVGVGADEDSRLAGLHAAMDDLGRLVGLSHRDGGELLGHLFLRAAAALGILAEPAVAHDVRVDAAGVHVDGRNAGAAQFLPKGVREPADRELR